MSEEEYANLLACRLLKEPNADPDDDLRMLSRQLLQRQEEVEALARFKQWVHDYLDSKGVPHHPPGVHGAEGCRIGDRMDYVWAEIDRLRAVRDAAVAEAVRTCEQPGCASRATHLACGRRVVDEYDTTGPRTPGRYCQRHAALVALEHKPECVVMCPHCKCMFGVG